jgi:hypothetical protein
MVMVMVVNGGSEACEVSKKGSVLLFMMIVERI